MEDVLQKIKALLAEAGPIESSGATVASGLLVGAGGVEVRYQLKLGWDIAVANVCDDTWGVFNIQLMRFIRSQNYDNAALGAVLAQVQVDDSHWRWLNKSLRFNSDEYKWFFLFAEGYPQAACLIYHPKPSAMDGQGIFYIEFLAVAPWNRDNPMRDRSFKGVGTTLIAEVKEYACAQLGLRPGFSLHALPRAAGFYQSIGMMNFPQLDKEGMPYFEMPA